MISKKLSHRVTRIIALFEAIKGGLVLFAGCGLLTLLHKNVKELATELLGHFHLNPSHRYPRIFIDAASEITDKRLWFFAAFALVYAAFRLVEAYGLWRERTWAEWVALVSGGIYLPIEIYEVLQKFTWIRVSVLIANLAVVVFMAQILWRSAKEKPLKRPGVSTMTPPDEPMS